ncbi:hypothetical protein [Corallococcus macrosporus]|uniref:Lipoprotein n=1 Tax=Corallococcus macrosporus DSM 14697 TaxID=1189310 RepID=A0A250K3Y9_9BACT|nr:hypothetical protein [Corallococcus macrosporus]ATB50733.1 hypothetical protein MYMAC_006389 [Corallococcus macrosporus DSM 14697]
MRLLRSLGNPLLAAVFTLAFPLAQAQAQECVEFKGLNHCGVGDAHISVGDEGVRIETGDTSGESGVVIHTGLARHWGAGVFSESDTPESGRMLLSSVSEGSTTSTASIMTEDGRVSYAATFTGAGEASTHSALIYYQGQLQHAAMRLANGTTGVTTPVGPINPGPTPPACRMPSQSWHACMDQCANAGYWDCNYCNVPCDYQFFVTNRGQCQWTIDLPHSYVALEDGSIIPADRLVLSEEVHGPTNYPYLGFDEIHLQTTANLTQIVSESVTPAER